MFANIQIASCFRSTKLAYRDRPREFHELAEQVLRVLASPPESCNRVGTATWTENFADICWAQRGNSSATA
ncbi:hypothetical protein SBA3_3450010 [Candidatus Sulfopaludibacter sp. SbA3]|nr:hypothetical protein SBA3_3450010 [Candidatus Sulfopaludibacter sp. SbA3]